MKFGRFTAPEPEAKESTLSKKLNWGGTCQCPVAYGILLIAVTQLGYLFISTAGCHTRVEKEKR